MSPEIAGLHLFRGEPPGRVDGSGRQISRANEALTRVTRRVPELSSQRVWIRIGDMRRHGLGGQALDSSEQQLVQAPVGSS